MGEPRKSKKARDSDEWAQHIQEDSQMSSDVIPSYTRSILAESDECCLSRANASLDDSLFGRKKYSATEVRDLTERETAGGCCHTGREVEHSNRTSPDRRSIGNGIPMAEKQQMDRSSSDVVGNISLLQHDPWTLEDAASVLGSLHYNSTGCQLASSAYHAAASVDEWRSVKMPTPSENPVGWQNLDRFACLLLSRLKTSYFRQRCASLSILCLVLKRVLDRQNTALERQLLSMWRNLCSASTDGDGGAGNAPYNLSANTRVEMTRLAQILQLHGQ